MKIEEKFCETKWGKICHMEGGHGKRAVACLHGWRGSPDFFRLIRAENCYAVMGHSLGASLAWELVASRMLKSKKLLLADAPAKPFWGLGLLPKASGWLEEILAGTSEVATAGMPSNLEALKSFSILRTLRLSRSLPVGVETVLLWGKTDKITPIDEFKLPSKNLEEVKVKMFDGGHGWITSQPEALTKAIHDFL